MNLPEEDVKRFYRLYNYLLFYVNKKHRIFENLNAPDNLHKSDPHDLKKLKDKLYASLELIDSFIRDNPENLSSEDLGIIAGWKNFIRDKFYIVRYLKKYAVFLDSGDPPKAYGVLGLINPFDVMMGSNLPIIVEATLLPFQDRIVYDGVLQPYNIFFGGNISKSINDSYRRAKTNPGIITSLPFSPEMGRPDDAEILRGYLKSEYSRENNREEIWDLIEKNPDLMTVYCEEMGRVDARTYRKRLKGMGIIEGWFALMDGIIIASGKTQKEAERTAKSLLPAEKMKLVYIFHLKGK